MERFVKIVFILSFVLITGVFIAGCSEDTGPAASGTSDTVAVTTTTGALYTAGDVVRSASGTESPAWLVVSYDSAGDSYTRALIYRNADGSYGYRTSLATESSKRAVMEKVYTVKITHVTVDSIPTSAPATVTTAVVADVTTGTARTTATTTAQTTTKSTARPSIKEMDPEEGEAGTTVSTVITGADFVSNLTATLRRSGEDSITATGVTRTSSTSITCTFDLPNTTRVGAWDIVITNPNGLSGEITNYFVIHGNTSAG